MKDNTFTLGSVVAAFLASPCEITPEQLVEVVSSTGYKPHCCAPAGARILERVGTSIHEY